MTELKNTTSLNESMKNQIISMLKNVITDDVHEENSYDELRDSLFNEDNDDTCANSTFSSNRVTINTLFSNRQDTQRFSTTKYASTLVIPEVVRSNKKFQTTNIENHSMNIDSDVEVTKKIKTVGNNTFKLGKKLLEDFDSEASDNEDLVLPSKFRTFRGGGCDHPSKCKADEACHNEPSCTYDAIEDVHV